MADGNLTPTMQQSIRHTIFIEHFIEPGVIVTMPYSVETLADFPVPVILNHVYDPFDMGLDVTKNVNELNDLIGRAEGDLVYAVIDLLGVDMSIGSAIQGVASVFLPREGMHTEHVFNSRVRMLVIGAGKVMELSVKSLRQDQYGNRMVELFPTREAAFEYIRQAVAV